MSFVKRSLGTKQIQLRSLKLQINGTLATPTATGFDQFGVKQVVDNGTGSWTIIFKEPFLRNCMVDGHALITPSRVLEVNAVASDRVTVRCRDLAGALADADFHLSILGSDFRYDI